MSRSLDKNEGRWKDLWYDWHTRGIERINGSQKKNINVFCRHLHPTTILIHHWRKKNHAIPFMEIEKVAKIQHRLLAKEAKEQKEAGLIKHSRRL